MNTSYVAHIRLLAKEIHSRLYKSGAELADIEQAGFLWLLEQPKERIASDSQFWVQYEAEARSYMKRAAGTLFDRVVSIDAINDNLSDGEGGDLLDFTDRTQAANEFRQVAPTSPGARSSVICSCREMLVRVSEVKLYYIVKIAPAKYEARLRLYGPQVVVGTFSNLAKAKAAQRRCLNNIIQSCQPIFGALENNHLLQKRSLKKQKTNVRFWIALARDHHPLSGVLQSFMYWNPLDVLIFIEQMSERTGVGFHAYELESREIGFYQKAKNGRTTISRYGSSRYNNDALAAA